MYVVGAWMQEKCMAPPAHYFYCSITAHVSTLSHNDRNEHFFCCVLSEWNQQSICKADKRQKQFVV